MGRPPCCDKVGVKKGPWTPEEDIILVSYIQEHGPGNWRAVPTNTGLLRCSKSCRLRWTNYLRPGIKRGNFTENEEKMIVHLQALLGNRWAAIASYIPQRTDNDIKNYWNTHLKKKLKKLQSSNTEGFPYASSSSSSNSNQICRGQWEKRLQTDIHMAKQALCDALSPEKSSAAGGGIVDHLKPSNIGYISYAKQGGYASSTENISKLLKGWKRNNVPVSSKSAAASTNSAATFDTDQQSSEDTLKKENKTCSSNIEISEAFDQYYSMAFLDSNFDSYNSDFSQSMSPEESKPDISPNDDAQLGQLSLLEKWLFDDGGITQGIKDNYNFNLSDISLDENANLF